LKPQNETSTLWFPVLAGALTGLVAGVVGGRERDHKARLVSGIVSAVVATITMFGADVVLTRMDGSQLAKKFPPRVSEQKVPVKETKPKPAGDTEKAALDPEKTPEERTDKTEGEGQSGEKPEVGGTDKNTEEGIRGTEPTTDAVESKQPAADGDGSVADIEARRAGRPAAADSPADREMGAKMLAELKRKQQINYWLQLIMPGIGILLAYQLSRGFSDQPIEMK
jgi:hypothetical protein